MASKVSDLIGLGMPDTRARRIGTLSVGSNLVATGTVITDALDLVNEYNHITTSSASTGVQLPDWPIGSRVEIDNASGQTINIFPPSATQTINSGSAGAAQTMATGKYSVLTRRTITDWRYVLVN